MTPSRRPVYLVAVLTGLRRGELGGITWADVDFDRMTVRVRVGVGKAAREDFIPLHPQAAAELSAIKPMDAMPLDLVFAAIPNDRTVRKDLRDAKVPIADDEGRVVDFHALRTTTGTMLARAGVSPQMAQRVMRHANMATTLTHYTDLRLVDLTGAVRALPEIGTQTPIGPEVAKATGTHQASALEGVSVVAPLVAQGAQNGAQPFGMVQSQRQPQNPLRLVGSTGRSAQPRYTSPLGTAVHRGAQGKGRGTPKPLNDNLLGAISAVG